MLIAKFEGRTIRDLTIQMEDFINTHMGELTGMTAEAPAKVAKKKTAKKKVTVAKAETTAPAAKATREQVSEAIQTVTTSKGLEAARTILDTFGADRISAIKEKDFGPVVRACEAATAEL